MRSSLGERWGSAGVGACLSILGWACLLLITAGCATFRSEVTGSDELLRTEEEEGVSTADIYRSVPASGELEVFFIFSHYRQTKGFDAIPKLEKQYQIIEGFDDFFQDAMGEFSGIGSYNAYTVFSSDVHDPKRRAMKDSLIEKSDYVVRVDVLDQDVFSHRVLAILGNSLSVTLLPMPYRHLYRTTVTLETPEGEKIARYVREGHTRKWVQTFLIFAYPFHPEKRKVEELYVAMLHGAFGALEGDALLRTADGGDRR